MLCDDTPQVLLQMSVFVIVDENDLDSRNRLATRDLLYGVSTKDGKEMDWNRVGGVGCLSCDVERYRL